MGFPAGSDGKESACLVGDPGSIPGLGRSLGEGNGCPLQYSCLENPVNRGEPGRLHSMGRTESDTTAQHIRLSLTSLSLIISRFINDAANGIVLFFFMDE